MPLTSLSVYKMQFMAALLIAQGLFLLRLPVRSRFPLRAAAAAVGCFLAALAFPILSYDALYISVMFLAFFALTIPAARFCFGAGWRGCVFCTVAGYSVQHLASVCYDMALTIAGFSGSTQVYSNAPARFDPIPAAIFLEVYALVYWALYQLFARRMKKGEDMDIQRPSLLVLVALTVLVEIVLNAVVIYHKYENLDLVYYLAASLANVVCSLSVLVVLFSLLFQKSLEAELEVVYQMWRQEQKQYEISKQTIDLINVKCHDMKHQIRAISRQAAIDPAALEEMESVISIYGTIVKTGSQALDIILAEKNLYCQKNGVTISCIADGAKLDFMTDSDIYSLFGNLLDNAIRSVTALEPDKRVISFSVRAERAFLSINSHNYYGGEVRMERGLPVSNQAETGYHGFGVKSMALIVEKYGGTISFHAKSQVFNVNILFPLNPDKYLRG
ncbi:MAG: sensor histidine kinase [Oscillospiraceae bacterium]|jgi:hypothetical protein|nr:sensor histidine kinase [Oscillospiraceae bacterium]